MLGVPVGDVACDGDRVGTLVGVTVADLEMEALSEGVRVAEGVGGTSVEVGVLLGVRVDEIEGGDEGVAVLEGVGGLVGINVLEAVGVLEGEDVTEDVGLGLEEGAMEGLGEGVGRGD